MPAEKEEGLFKSLFESAPDFFIHILDTKGKIIKTSPAILKVSGYSEEEMVGRFLADFFTPASRKIFEEQFPELLETGYARQEVEFVCKDGRVITVDCSASALRNEMGEIEGVVAFQRDISAQKEVEGALKESEEILKAISDAAQDAIIMLDDYGNVTYWNKAAERIFGFKAEEIIGKELHMILAPPSYRDKYRKGIEKFRKSGEGPVIGKTLELKALRKDGTEFPMELSVNKVKMRGKWHAIGIVRDISERKRVEERLRESEAKFRTLAETTPAAIFIYQNTKIRYANPACETLTGYTGEELLEMNFWDIAHPDFREFIKERGLARLRGEEVPSHYEIKILTKYGEERWIDVAGALVEFEGQPAVIGTAYDITERKQAEEAIIKYAAELEEANRLKTLFLDIIRHDIKNSIAVAYGYVDLLIGKETDETKKKFLETIQKSLDKALDIMENTWKLSLFEKLESIERKKIDLKIMLEDVIKSFKPEAREEGIIIENEVTESMPIKANEILEEVFSNLISNAIKYASEGKKIIIKSEEKESSWRIKVIDFGPGIEDEYKEAVFERFKRKEKKGVRGSGLGLAIAKRVVELHSGRIWVEDNPKGGAVFVVELPKGNL